tara:strand:- start:976 stop:1728 length:753 start_codon:yes stop_codon:yes gene_type:complete
MSERKDAQTLPQGMHVVQALGAFMSDCPTITCDSQGAFGAYVSLAKLRRVTQPILAKHGLVSRQTTESTAEGAIKTVSHLSHPESGEEISTELVLTVERPTYQSAAAAGTYGKRVSLQSLLGVASDGEEASLTENLKGGEDLESKVDPVVGPAPPRGAAPVTATGDAVKLSYVTREGKRGEFYRFTATDGRAFNLFSNSPFIEAAKSAADASLPVNLEFKQDGKWLELVGIEPAGNPDDTQEFSPNDIPF